MRLAIIQYNAGNIQSLTFALNRLGVEPILSDDHEVLMHADKVIFPGVGEASSCMRYLGKANLNELIPNLKQPVLGICLGMQLMCSHSDENDTDCLGVFDAKVRKFSPGPEKLKVPHMGWNTILERKTPLLNDLPEASYTYFVHSYYVEPGEETIATTNYGIPFSAAMHKGNFYATQFHPEKSGLVGAKILQNFLDL